MKPPVNIKRAAVALGVSYSFTCAMKKAAGIHSRLFDLKRLQDWWAANQDFKKTDAYPSADRRAA